MARNNPHIETAASSAKPNLHPAAFADAGTKGIESMFKMQAAFFDTVQEINQDWFGRAKLEVDTTSRFVTKLSAARSIPDAMAVSQEWAKRRMDMLVEDGRHLLSDSQKIIGAGARSASNGWNGSRT